METGWQGDRQARGQADSDTGTSKFQNLGVPRGDCKILKGRGTLKYREKCMMLQNVTVKEFMGKKFVMRMG